MLDQASFDFTAQPKPPAAGTVAALVYYLKHNPGFHTRRQIARSLGLSERKVRKLAETSDGMIASAPGSPGYCHIHHCPLAKSCHIADSLISQGKSMIQRGIKLRHKAHSIIR